MAKTLLSLLSWGGGVNGVLGVVGVVAGDAVPSSSARSSSICGNVGVLGADASEVGWLFSPLSVDEL